MLVTISERLLVGSVVMRDIAITRELDGIREAIAFRSSGNGVCHLWSYASIAPWTAGNK